MTISPKPPKIKIPARVGMAFKKGNDIISASFSRVSAEQVSFHYICTSPSSECLDKRLFNSALIKSLNFLDVSSVEMAAK